MRKRLVVISELIDKTSRHVRALDFGPGFGALLPTLSSEFELVDGVDIDSSQIEAAQVLVHELKCKNVTLTLVEPGAEFVSMGSHVYDCIVAADVLEHIDSASVVLDGFQRILAQDGVLIVSLPTENLLYRMFESKESGHVYHDRSGFRAVTNSLAERFTIRRRISVYGFFQILSCSLLKSNA